MDCQIGRLLGSHLYVIGIFYDKIQFTCLLSIIVFHMVHITYLLSAFRKKEVWSQLKPSILVHAMVSQDWLFLDRLVYLNMGSFIVFGLLMYWAYSCN